MDLNGRYEDISLILVVVILILASHKISKNTHHRAFVSLLSIALSIVTRESHLKEHKRRIGTDCFLLNLAQYRDRSQRRSNHYVNSDLLYYLRSCLVQNGISHPRAYSLFNGWLFISVAYTCQLDNGVTVVFI